MSKRVLQEALLGDPPFGWEEEPLTIDKAVSRIIKLHLEGASEFSETLVERAVDYHAAPAIKRIVQTRWQINRAALQREFDLALELGEKLFAEAVEAGVDTWLLRNIAIDLRNLEVEKYHAQDSWFDERESKWQRRLDETKLGFYYPIVDRQVSNAFEHLLLESFKEDTDQAEVVRFGTSLEQSLEALSSAMTISVLFGSYTYLYTLRNQAGYLLFQYGRRFQNAQWVIAAANVLLAGNRFDDVRRIYRSQWPLLYPTVVDDAAALIRLPVKHSSHLTNRVAKCLMLELLGEYLSDDELISHEDFLYESIRQPLRMATSYDVKRAALQVLKVIGPRLDAQRLVENLLVSGTQHRLVLDGILQVLQKLNWKQIGQPTRGKTLEWLEGHMTKFLDARSAYHLLATIEKENEKRSDVFRRLRDEWAETGGIGEGPAIYLARTMGFLSSDHVHMLLGHFLDEIESQNERMVQGSPIGIGGTSRFYLVAMCARRAQDFQWERLVSVYEEVLKNDYQSDQVKYEVLDSLVLMATDEDLLFPEKLRVWIQALLADPPEGLRRFREIMLLRRQYEKKLRLAMQDLEISFVSEIDWSSILGTWVELGEGSLPMLGRRIIRSISHMIESGQDYPGDSVNLLLYRNTFDRAAPVRADAVVVFAESVARHKGWIELGLKRLRELALDPEPYVRSAVVHAAGRWLAQTLVWDETMSLLRELALDPHYAIRLRASKLLESKRKKHNMVVE